MPILITKWPSQNSSSAYSQLSIVYFSKISYQESIEGRNILNISCLEKMDKNPRSKQFLAIIFLTWMTLGKEIEVALNFCSHHENLSFSPATHCYIFVYIIEMSYFDMP